MASSPQTVTYRKDYKPPAYLIDQIRLHFNLDLDRTEVNSCFNVCARDANSGDLVLDGEDIELHSIEVAGKVLQPDQYSIGNDQHPGCLIIKKSLLPTHKPMKPFQVKVRNSCFPKKNTALSGLYSSGDLLCTQCESEGFRRMTYFVDRPDNMARFQVKLTAEKAKYPVLLSNGDSVSRREFQKDGKEYIEEVFVDPSLKPCYLFAIVAGPLEVLSSTFTTMELEDQLSREVDVQVYGEKKYIHLLDWAVECLKRAMKWDEDTYGRVYELSTYRLVCIADFNYGAMENKSLNTFNINCIAATPETSDDFFFARVLQVIGHEYFHNWSGNRVTVKDWFQITLKEGLTNFRDHHFSEDAPEFSKAATRISTASGLRYTQFPEDAGAMAHPIRPESYVAIDNFYTATVYEKGMEVIRMYRTLAGREKFRKGNDLYYKKYDGKAVSCDEYRNAIAEAAGLDLRQFERWYTQRGTPKVIVVKRNYEAEKKKYEITIKQVVPRKALGDKEGDVYHIPVLIGLIGRTSKKDLLVNEPNGTRLCELREAEQTFVFDNVAEDCVPSIMRDFSAPVLVENGLSGEELGFLSAYDSDSFNRWDSLQAIYRQIILERAENVVNGKYDLANLPALPSYLLEALGRVLAEVEDGPFLAYCMATPAVEQLIDDMKPYADPVVLSDIRRAIVCQVSKHFHSAFKELYERCAKVTKTLPFKLAKEDVSRRALQACALTFLMLNDDIDVEVRGNMAWEQMTSANNYALRQSAFVTLVDLKGYSKREEALKWIYDKADTPTMKDVWFARMVQTYNVNAIETVEELVKHPDFQSANPNRFRALVQSFCKCNKYFHDRSGKGYEFAAKETVRYDALNGQIAAHIATSFIKFKEFDKKRQDQIISQLKWMNSQKLSKQTREIVEKGLKYAEA